MRELEEPYIVPCIRVMEWGGGQDEGLMLRAFVSKGGDSTPTIAHISLFLHSMVVGGIYTMLHMFLSLKKKME